MARTDVHSGVGRSDHKGCRVEALNTSSIVDRLPISKRCADILSLDEGLCASLPAPKLLQTST